jgi:uncharacterized protein (TIGR00375 family)
MREASIRMQTFDADLHIHSPYSIAVSQSLNLDTMWETAKKKGLSILGTGDITQPDWRKYLQEKLHYQDGIYSFKELHFLIQTELEDAESIHHLVFLPDFHAAEQLQQLLTPFVKNIEGRWAGRPHVNKSPAEIVEIIEDMGGMSGPAHAFTPFKSIFRQGKYATLEQTYDTTVKKIKFLELGLSADTNLADRLQTLQEITFLSNSDAHSQGVSSLGREFNRIQIESPTFDEIKLALDRRQNRRVILNVGLDPRLGKYYIMFCKNCRRRVLRQSVSNKIATPSDLFGMGKVEFDENFLRYRFPSVERENEFLNQVARNKIECHACKTEFESKKEKTKKQTIPKLSLGVSERINEIANWTEPHHPDHRPKYLDFIPLIEILRAVRGIRNKNAKSLESLYDQIIAEIGTEFQILVDIPLERLQKFEDGKLTTVINAFRTQKVNYIPGGGGTFGQITFNAFE